MEKNLHQRSVTGSLFTSDNTIYINLLDLLVKNLGNKIFFLKTGTWKTASRVAVVTMNGAIGGGLSVLLLNVSLSFKRDYLLNIPEFVGGVLGGLVAITAPANVIRPWEAVVIGMIGGLCTVGGKYRTINSD